MLVYVLASLGGLFAVGFLALFIFDRLLRLRYVPAGLRRALDELPVADKTAIERLNAYESNPDERLCFHLRRGDTLVLVMHFLQDTRPYLWYSPPFTRLPGRQGVRIQTIPLDKVPHEPHWTVSEGILSIQLLKDGLFTAGFETLRVLPRETLQIARGNNNKFLVRISNSSREWFTSSCRKHAAFWRAAEDNPDSKWLHRLQTPSELAERGKELMLESATKAVHNDFAGAEASALRAIELFDSARNDRLRIAANLSLSRLLLAGGKPFEASSRIQSAREEATAMSMLDKVCESAELMGECLLMQQRPQEARAYFEELIALRGKQLMATMPSPALPFAELRSIVLQHTHWILSSVKIAQAQFEADKASGQLSAASQTIRNTIVVFRGLHRSVPNELFSSFQSFRKYFSGFQYPFQDIARTEFELLFGDGPVTFNENTAFGLYMSVQNKCKSLEALRRLVGDELRMMGINPYGPETETTDSPNAY